MKKPYLKKNNEQGFSLVEFIVVLVIFSIMSGTSLFNFNRYQDSIQTTNIAQDIALSIRQAQIYGLSGSDRIVGAGELDEEGESDQIFGDAGGNSSNFGGVQIDNIANDRSIRGVAIRTNPQELIIFEDLNRNFEYNPDNDRTIDIRTILARNINMSVCLIDFSASVDINDCSEEVIEDDEVVSIVFQRPYPDAFIEYNNTSYGHVFIELKDNSMNPLKYIEINPIGNISVKSYE